MRKLGLGFINPVGRGEWWACVCVWVAVVWVMEVGRGFGPGSGGVVWCYVCVSCEL